MSAYTVEAWELQYIDPTANARKFYRIYVIAADNNQAWTVLQWGRIGTAGQWKLQLHPTQAAAMAQAMTQDREKSSKGYNRVSSPVRFLLPQAVATKPDVNRSLLERGYFDAARLADGRVDTEAGERIAERDVKDAEAFKATLLRLAGKLEDAPVTNGTAAPAADDMEAKLAAAIAKAKAAKA